MPAGRKSEVSPVQSQSQWTQNGRWLWTRSRVLFGRLGCPLEGGLFLQQPDRRGTHRPVTAAGFSGKGGDYFGDEFSQLISLLADAINVESDLQHLCDDSSHSITQIHSEYPGPSQVFL